jgi:hypothetical protein
MGRALGSNQATATEMDDGGERASRPADSLYAAGRFDEAIVAYTRLVGANRLRVAELAFP